jgi:hypothetical protein
MGADPLAVHNETRVFANDRRANVVGDRIVREAARIPQHGVLLRNVPADNAATALAGRRHGMIVDHPATG